MTDAEIIKALEVCVGIHNDCESCPLLEYSQATDECMTEVMNNALDLINRQKAKIEELSEVLSDTIRIRYDEAKAEAIKEFAERLKEYKYQSSDWSHGEHPFVIEESDIDNLVKEMAGDTE